MSHLQYFTYPGFGERASELTHYSQAVRVDNQLHLSGQGGWNRETDEISTDRTEEVRRAFENVDYAIKQAGGKGMDQVYQLRVYLKNMSDEGILDVLVDTLKEWFPKHKPTLTVIGVERLYLTMQIEVEVDAHLGSG